jgi:hypothetical protein
MRKGEISKFLFSPDYAYREMGCPPRIPPSTTGKESTDQIGARKKLSYVSQFYPLNTRLLHMIRRINILKSPLPP